MKTVTTMHLYANSRTHCKYGYILEFYSGRNVITEIIDYLKKKWMLKKTNSVNAFESVGRILQSNVKFKSI